MIVPKWPKMAQYDSKTSKNVPKWSKMPQNALKWTKNGQKRLEMTKNGPKKHKNAFYFFIELNWPRIILNWIFYWIELAQNNFELNIFWIESWQFLLNWKLNWIIFDSFLLNQKLNWIIFNSFLLNQKLNWIIFEWNSIIDWIVKLYLPGLGEGEFYSSQNLSRIGEWKPPLIERVVRESEYFEGRLRLLPHTGFFYVNRVFAKLSDAQIKSWVALSFLVVCLSVRPHR